MSTLLQPVIALEELVLQGLHALGLAWGLAIVVLTLLVRLALVPLAVHQAQGRRRRAAHSPQIRALRERHREDAVALRAGLAAYRERHGVRRRGALVAIALLAPLPLMLAATQMPAGILVYLIVSAAFGIAQKLALPAPVPVA
jgi:YidC/Oxa1 family membrane protein insertase